MNKKRNIGEGFAVETHGRASLSTMARETHGRASLRAMPAGKAYGRAFLPAGKARGGMFLLVALVFLFGACEKEIPESVGEGEKVEIFFSTDITGYHAAGDMVRSGVASEPISTIVSLNGDFHLRATLVPDSEEELRDNEGFMDGQKLCFAAYGLDGTQVGATAVYTYSTAHGWLSSAPLEVVPSSSTEYRFVAYSYFESTATPSETGIDPVYDLVWGKSEDTKIEDETVAKRTVTIHMTHKFARVKVRVRSTRISTAMITALSGVEVAGGKLATLNPFDGDVTFGSAATQGVNITVPSPAENDIESSYRTVTPVGSGTVDVKLGMVKVSTASSVTFSDKWAAFSGTLDEAKSYTLVVDLRKGVGFAYSNIYWEWYDDEDGDPNTHLNGGRLTFDTVDKGHQGYQGVLFKFGSLVGVSPALVNGSNVYDDKHVPIYVPIYDSGTPSKSTWKATTSITQGWPKWPSENTVPSTSIPYVTTTNQAGGHSRGSTYMMDADRNTASWYLGFRGDVCQYISMTGAVTGFWRLPTGNEFGGLSDWTTGGGTTEDNTLGNAEGTIDLLTAGGAWAKSAAMGDMVFPASGWRSFGSTGGALSNVGQYGYYWSGSHGNGWVSYNMDFTSSTMKLADIQRYLGFPVRCVQGSIAHKV